MVAIEHSAEKTSSVTSRAADGTYRNSYRGVPLVDMPAALNYTPLRFGMRLLGGDLRGTREQLDSFSAWTQVGDPAADALVAYMKRSDVDSAEVRRMFNRALEGGIVAVENPPQELVDYFREAEAVPYWVDFKRIDRGSGFMRSWGVDSLPVFVIGLSVGYLSEQANWVMVRAGELHKRAAPRAVETATWIHEVIQPGALLPGGMGYQAVVRLRLTHAFVRSGVGKRKDWDPAYTPMHQGVYVNAILLFSMVASVLGGLLGHIPSKKDADAIYHTWRYIAYLMGIDPLLIPADSKDMFRLARAAIQENVDVTSKERMADGLKLGRALIDAYGQVAGVTGKRIRARAFRYLAESFTSTVTQLALGSVMADSIGYRRPAYWLVPLWLMYSTFNFTRMRLPRLVPGGRARYEAKQSRRSAKLMESAAKRLELDTSFVRE